MATLGLSKLCCHNVEHNGRQINVSIIECNGWQLAILSQLAALYWHHE